MRGYKGTKEDMTCRGFQFELGKTYKAQGEIEVCRNGFHFCKNLGHVFDYYPPDDGNRFFEIEAKEPIRRAFAKYVTTEISFIRELSAKEISRVLYGDGNGYGDNNERGDGYGDGSGHGGGYGNGYSSGYGDGNNSGIDNGNGYGDGNCRNGRGGGYGDSDGNYGGIKNNIHRTLNFKEGE